MELVIAAYQENPEMSLEVFVHKADALSEEYKIGEFTPGGSFSPLGCIAPFEPYSLLLALVPS